MPTLSSKTYDPPRTTGATRFYAETQLGGPTRSQESQFTVPNTTTQVLNSNPDRVGLVFVNNTTNPIWVFITPNFGGNQGIQLPSGGGAISLNIHDDFTLITETWYGIAGTSPSLLYILETISDVILPPETGG